MVPAIRMSAPSLPGQVAVTTLRPASRAFTHSGSAVGGLAGPSGDNEYPPIGAAKPLIEVPIVAATGWNVFATMSLCTAVEPVAIAMCDTAVTDGVAVMVSNART